MELKGLSSIPKSFQSKKYIRFPKPKPQAELIVSWLAPVVNPPSPSNANTFTSSAPAYFKASAAPAAKGDPCPLGPVLALKNNVFPSISACPGNPPFCLRVKRSSQVN